MKNYSTYFIGGKNDWLTIGFLLLANAILWILI